MGLKWNEVIKNIQEEKRAATPQEILCLERLITRNQKRGDTEATKQFQEHLDWLRRQPE
jgi:hypothetical protein